MSDLTNKTEMILFLAEEGSERVKETPFCGRGREPTTVKLTLQSLAQMLRKEKRALQKWILSIGLDLNVYLITFTYAIA